MCPAASGSPKDEVTLKKWFNRLADTLKRLPGKVAEDCLPYWEVLLVLF